MNVQFWQASETSDDAERNARAVWSVIAEPTDPAARLLWLALGPREALDVALNGTVAQIAQVLDAARGLPDASLLNVTRAQETPKRSHSAAIAARAQSLWQARADRDAFSVLERSGEQGIEFSIPGDEAWIESMGDLGINAPIGLWSKSALAGNRFERGSAPAAPHGNSPDENRQLPARHPFTRGPSIAIVGSRASTPYGNDIAHEWAYSCAERGITVISGGAFGIDAAAHSGALAARPGAQHGGFAGAVHDTSGWGSTAAFLAGGLDEYYPRGNAQLLTDIAAYGALYSEAAIGAAPTRWRFLSRNRLIAAASHVTLVVEAAWRSGALSTASHADSLSRHVAAVPGSIRSAASGGCHMLVRDRGAQLVTCVEELVELLADAVNVESRFVEPREGGSARTESPNARGGLFTAEVLSAKDRLVFDGIPQFSAISIASLARECAVTEAEARLAIERISLIGLVEHTARGVRRVRAA